MKTVYLGLGANLGAREQALETARRLLEREGLRIRRVSSLYETEPMELASQPWFLNQVVEAETTLFPLQLLSRIHRIEIEMGRKRIVAKGPRTIDIDILFYGRFTIDSPKLSVPHPRFRERRFVLAPMAEIAPDFRDPVSRKSMRELLAALSGQTVRKLAVTT
ncbi:MAG: 2-amino-4-hydroxy-6-hydroxymethyldihydropteridine diphosphokinase [Bryobacterales bacterium]|nr:2-amino-4-hydroxy-6-hydroxymethyldihydropteridine diphosphokinase [Bryobacterales bacterium]